jgi:hypothetical protein
MLPPVSVPRAVVVSRATRAAPEPPLDPPGMRSWFHGLRVVPKALELEVVMP